LTTTVLKAVPLPLTCSSKQLFYTLAVFVESSRLSRA
jgi:hypothetical protein